MLFSLSLSLSLSLSVCVLRKEIVVRTFVKRSIQHKTAVLIVNKGGQINKNTIPL